MFIRAARRRNRRVLLKMKVKVELALASWHLATLRFSVLLGRCQTRNKVAQQSCSTLLRV